MVWLWCRAGILASMAVAQTLSHPWTVVARYAAQGRLKMHVLKMQDWKMTDKILDNSGQNYGVWKMQDWKMTDHVN